MAHNPLTAAVDPNLPLELVDIILDRFNDDATSRATLAPLLWVSRAFASLVRRRLFRSLKVKYYHYDRTQPRINLLYDILQGDPSIVNYVRKLELVFDKQHSHCRGVGDDPHESSDSEVDAECEVRHPNPVRSKKLAKILHMFSKSPLSELEIYGRHCRGKTWPSFYGPRTLGALFTLRCNPNLRKLSFHHLREIPGFLITGLPSTDRVEELMTNHAVYIWLAVPCRCLQCRRRGHRTPCSLTNPYDSCTTEEGSSDDEQDGTPLKPPKSRPSSAAYCLKLNPLVQPFILEKDQRPFSRLKTIHLPRKCEFPWTLCFPVVELKLEGRPQIQNALALDYSTENAIQRDYSNTEEDVKVPKLADFQFTSLERLIIGNLGAARRTPWGLRSSEDDRYESVVDILDRAGPNFRILELRDRFQHGIHDLPTFPLNGIFKSGKISVLRINTEEDPSGCDSAENAADAAFKEVDTIATFLAHNAPLPGLTEISLSLMWPGWEVETLLKARRSGESNPWERLHKVIKKSAVRKLDIAVGIRKISASGIPPEDVAREISAWRTWWMGAMDLGKDVAVKLSFQVDDDEWGFRDPDGLESDVWY